MIDSIIELKDENEANIFYPEINFQLNTVK